MTSSVVALALAGSPAAAPACSWDRPGQNPFYGDVAAAVDRYRDIPADVRARLKARMVRRDYDDMVSIRRDSIDGARRYDPAIRDMHFGNGAVCGSVTRAGWAPQAEERGLVYCEAEQCILVPTVCRNVSRISRLPAAGPALAAGGAPAGPEELVFAPPGAGNAADGLPPTFAGRSGPTGFDGGGPGGIDGGAPGSFGGNDLASAVAPTPFLPGIPAGLSAAVSAVPEAPSGGLLALGLGALLWRRRRRVDRAGGRADFRRRRATAPDNAR